MEKDMKNARAFEHSRAFRTNWLLNRAHKLESLAALSSSFQKEQDDEVATQDADDKDDEGHQGPVVEETPREDAVVTDDHHDRGPVDTTVHSPTELENKADSTGECVQPPSYQAETKSSAVKEDEAEIKMEVSDQSPKHEEHENVENEHLYEEDDQDNGGDHAGVDQYVGQIGDSGQVGGDFDFDKLDEIVFSNGPREESGLFEDEKEALLHGQFIPFGGAVAPPSRGLMASARNHC